MEFLKNVKIYHDERRDIDYVQDAEIVDRLPKIEEEFEGCVVGAIDKTYVDIEERRQEDYDFYELSLFEANAYIDDANNYGAENVDYLSDRLVAIKKEQ